MPYVGSSVNAPQLSSVNAVGTQQTPRQAGAALGDTIVVLGTHERSGAPTLGGIPGLTAGPALADSDFAAVIGWKRLLAADLDVAPTLTASGGLTRRMALGFVLFRAVAAPKFTAGTRVTLDSTNIAAPHPPVTPAKTGALVLSLTAALSSIEPYQRTFAPTSGWTERFETGSTSTTAINAYAMASTVAGGAAGAQVAGNVVTDVSSTPTRYAYWPVSVVLEADLAPVVDAGEDRTKVLPYAPVRIDAAVAGGTAPYALAVTQTAGPATPVAVAAGTPLAAELTAPATIDGDTLTYRVRVTDAAGEVGEDLVSVGVLPHPDWVWRAGRLVPVERLLVRRPYAVGAARSVLIGATATGPDDVTAPTTTLTSPAPGAATPRSLTLAGGYSDEASPEQPPSSGGGSSPGADVTAPTTTLSSPTSGATVSRTFTPEGSFVDG